jgi:hypothetical protein
VVKALSELKIATAISTSPRRMDIPRIMFRKTPMVTAISAANLGTISTSATVPSFGTFQFALSEIANSGSYAGSYDSYRLVQVTVRFVPCIKTFVAGGSYPPLLTAIDYDDATAWTSLSQPYSYDTLTETPVGGYVERTLMPRTATAIYSGSAFTAFSQTTPGSWVDLANPSAPYYGIKWGINTTALALIGAWYVDADFVFQFKDARH